MRHDLQIVNTEQNVTRIDVIKTIMSYIMKSSHKELLSLLAECYLKVKEHSTRNLILVYFTYLEVCLEHCQEVG